MSSGSSAGAVGRLHRLAPASPDGAGRARLRYPIFMVLLDIDRIPELMAASPFTSYNRWNWASFRDADHLGPHDVPMRER